MKAAKASRSAPSPRRRSATACVGLLLAGALALAASPAQADRLRLEGGGEIVVERWWVEDDTLHYDGPMGTVGIPRAMVLSIVRDAPGSPAAPVEEEHAEKTDDDARRDAAPPRAPRSMSDRADADEELRAGLLRAREALEARDFDTAARAFWDVLGDDPDLTRARVGYALAEMAQERDGMALAVVLDGLVREADHPQLLELLGDLRDREERVEDALRAWERAQRVKPSTRLKRKIERAQRELAAGRDHDLGTTSHFTVRYDGDVDRTLAAQVMDYLEEQFLEMSSLFLHAPAQPVTVQLLAERDFRDVTQAPEWVGGLYDGKIRVPLGGLNRLDPRAEGLLRHELTHAFVHSKTRGNCPRWLHEGLAQIQQRRPLREADQQTVRRDLAGGRPEEWTGYAFSYPGALSLTRFLEERRGLHGLNWVLDELGNGRSLDEALRGTYGWDYPETCRRWAESLGGERR